MQELKCTAERFPREAFAELGYTSEVYGQRTYNGVGIVARSPITDVQRGFPDDEEGAHARLIAATIEGIRIVNVYVPNGQSVGTDKYQFKLEWMRRLREYFDDDYWSDDEVLLCGDFNVAPKTATYTIRNCGAGASSSASRKRMRLPISKSGALRMLSGSTNRAKGSIRGGTTARAVFVKTSA
jgi:exodeoxyribonuclease III